MLLCCELFRSTLQGDFPSALHVLSDVRLAAWIYELFRNGLPGDFSRTLRVLLDVKTTFYR